MNSVNRPRGKVLGVLIDAISWDSALSKILSWAEQGESRTVCICNVHSVVTAESDRAFSQALQESDMATADGMPLAWVLRGQGFGKPPRINGPDLMWKLCAGAEAANLPIFLYGNTDATLNKLKQRLLESFARLKIAGMISPPFRPLTAEEDAEVVDSINRSGARLMFVSLGCPKQEKWMFEHRGEIRSVMLGVGAAFAYHTGELKRAPMWMQQMGLEWLVRLMAEPRRLWKRYLVTNTLFLWGIIRQIVL